jgi:hypothetical protein
MRVGDRFYVPATSAMAIRYFNPTKRGKPNPAYPFCDHMPAANWSSDDPPASVLDSGGVRPSACFGELYPADGAKQRCFCTNVIDIPVAGLKALFGTLNANPLLTKTNRSRPLSSLYFRAPVFKCRQKRAYDRRSTPNSPSEPGAMTICALLTDNDFSGVTTSSLNVFSHLFLFYCLGFGHFLGRFKDFLDTALHVKGLLGNVVMLAFADLFETPAPYLRP